MKKTIITLSILTILIFSFCAFEKIYLNLFANDLREQLETIQIEDNALKLDNEFKNLTSYLEKNKWILEQVTPRAEIELLFISLGHLEDYLMVENLPEARVAAGEMMRILDDIVDPPMI